MAIKDEHLLVKGGFAHRFLTEEGKREAKEKAELAEKFFKLIPEEKRETPFAVARCRQCTASLVRGPEASLEPVLDVSKLE